MTGIGLVFCLVTGAWVAPLAFTATSQFALIANYSEPLTWPTRPPADRGGGIAAMVVFAVGLVAFTISGPRIRPSGELYQAYGRICPGQGALELPPGISGGGRRLRRITCSGLAEDRRFELLRGCPQHAFQACALGH